MILLFGLSFVGHGAVLALLLLKEPCESLTDIVPNTGAALPDDAGNVVDWIFLFLFHKNVRTYY